MIDDDSEQQEVDIPEIFLPLLEVVAGEHPEVTRVIITGGRESSKTFTTGIAMVEGVVQYDHRVLYTRYTLTSAEKSIIPSVENRAKLINKDSYLKTVGKSMYSKCGIGKIDFAGFKTASGNQSAALKSLEDYSILVCEEAEEYPSLEEWEKVDLSIRAKDVNPFSIMILNPTSKTHWIYGEFFESRGVKDGYNGIVGDTLYIHSTYLDLGKKYVAKKNWDKFEAARLVHESVIDREKKGEHVSTKDKSTSIWYTEVVLGGWKSSVDGVLIKEWDYFSEWPEENPSIHIFGLDWGFDPDPMVLIEMRKYGNKMFVKQHIYKTKLLNDDIMTMINEIVPENCYIVADSAEKKTIADFRKKGIALIAAKKPPGSIRAGIKKINNSELYVHRDSTDIHHELRHYHSIEIVNKKGELTIHIVDKDNHAIDSIRYADSLY